MAFDIRTEDGTYLVRLYSTLTNADLIALANAGVTERMRSRFANAFKSALIASDVVHFGFARMYMTLMDHPQIRLAIFPTTSAALQWINAAGLELPDHAWAPGPPSGPDALDTN